MIAKPSFPCFMHLTYLLATGQETLEKILDRFGMYQFTPFFFVLLSASKLWTSRHYLEMGDIEVVTLISIGKIKPPR